MYNVFATSNRAVRIFGPLFALALVTVISAPVSAQEAADELLPERGISVVPLETPDAGEAGEIAALANGSAEAPIADLDKAEAAPAEEAFVAELDKADAAPFDGVASPAELYQHLVTGGYAVEILRRDYQGRYIFLVKSEHSANSVLLLVDAEGAIVEHRRIVQAAHPAAPVYNARPHNTYNHRPAAYQNCRQHNAANHGYRNVNRWARY